MVSTASAQQPDADSQGLSAADGQKIKQVLTAQVEAWNAHDLERFMETYWKSPDLSFSSGGQTTRGWDATLQRYRQRYSDAEQMGRLKFSELEIHGLGPQAAYVLGRWHLTREQNSIEGNFTLVLRQLDSGWKIVHDHSSLEEED